jgi:predicted transcriptional regulator
MPKVYISERQRTTESYKRRIKALIKAKMAEMGISQGEIAERLGVSQQSISYGLKHGSLSIIQLIQLDGLLRFTDADINKLFERRIESC